MAEEIAQEPTLEDIENLFAELFNQMSSASKKLTQLGKRIREETAAVPPMPDIDALEREYQTLPVSTRPSWFEFVASNSESLPEAKKFAHQ